MERDSAIPFRACVFGASGGIGAALVSRLASVHGEGTIYAGSRSGTVRESMNVRPFRFDITDEPSIASAARQIGHGGPLDLVIVATGILHGDGIAPEKTWRALDSETMMRVLAINTVGPAIMAKHFLPLLNTQRRAVFAALSARVGSITDNRIGGWHSYRASKAALNMLVRSFAIELSRTNRRAIAVALHPGTVDSALSRPFQANLPDGQLADPQSAAQNLIDVIARLAPSDSGNHFAWDGSLISA